jgi:hypothetical protein
MLDTIDRAESITTELPLDTAAKRALIETELRKDAGRSDREIARVVGADHKTVGSWRAKLGIASPLGNSPPTPTEQRHMLIEGCKDFDKRYPSGPSDGHSVEEAVDNAIANGVVSLGAKCPPPPGVVDEPKFDPFDPKHGVMVVPHQPAIAVYENTQGAIVICQCASAYDEDDPIILVRPENLDALIVQLRKHLP